MSGDRPAKRCLVAYATPERQYLWPVVLPDEATLKDALDAARRLATAGEGGPADIPWDEAIVGIFGEVCDRSIVPRDGDRIEIYRPLRNDPKQARRDRAAAGRRRPPEPRGA